MSLIKKFGLLCIVVFLLSTSSQAVIAEEKYFDDVDEESIGSVIKHVRDRYNDDSGLTNRKDIAEWLTRVVDDRLINSNSSEFFTRPVYAWLAVHWVREDPSNSGEYFDQANTAWSKGYGNCGENSAVVYYILKKAGVKENVRFLQAGENRSHSFTVWGLPPTAQTGDPTTWDDALIVDPWVGEVLDGPEARDHYWFQNGEADTPIHDGTKTIDADSDAWMLVQKREEHRTGTKIVENNPIDDEIDDLLGGCYIATAVYDTPLNDEINELRAYRDNEMRNNVLGRMFISSYEKFGPVAALYISQEESRRVWARINIVEPALEFIKKI